MAIRIKIKIECGDKSLETSALVNSGFETETPQLILPLEAAKLLGLWPPTQNAKIEEYDTAGGPVIMWVYQNILKVRIEEPIKSKLINCDAVISNIEDEVLISDKLAGELNIIGEDFGKGLWRLRGEASIFESEKPRKWKK